MWMKRTIRAAAAALSAGAASRPHVRHHHLHATTPTIVLVHGAWADAGSWDAVVGRLQRDGCVVWAPPNPLTGLVSDSGTIADFLHRITGPIVLVGHSYGGAVITNAAYRDSQVKALVYVDAFIPAQGDTLESLTGAGSCFHVSDLSTVFTFVPFPGAPPTVFDAYVKQSVFPGCFANGLPAREGAQLAATQRPLGDQRSHGPVRPSRLGHHPVLGRRGHRRPCDPTR